MEQKTLFGKPKEPVELKESYGGFEVCYPEHINYHPKSPQLVRWGKKIVEKYSSYEIAKEDFEKEIRINYEADIIWMKSKFPDSKGVFWLEGIKVKWELEAEYSAGMYHFDFNSGKIPNLMTETGYRSHFSQNLDFYSTIEEYLKECVEHIINYDEKGTKKKKSIKYNLSFKDDGYKPKKQFTLTELEGGVK